MANWHFARQRRDDVDDETTVSKNFARESRKLVGVFVREFFQNVLDAATASEVPHVRVAVVDQTSGLTAAQLLAPLSGLEAHLDSAGHDPALRAAARTNALVLEEFGTTGLLGDYRDSRAKGRNQRWANFWFGEGKRTKTGNSLGRAGQGKITYHQISGVQAVFAVTHRVGDSKPVLFGKCIVQRTHELNGTHYKRHGYWPSLGTDDQPLPSDDAAEIDTFKKCFGLNRNGRTGTSWIIPFVDAAAFTKEGLIGDILRDFFFSIMAGKLTVDVFGTTINQANLPTIIAQFPASDLEPGFISFLEEAITTPHARHIQAADGWYGKSSEAPIAEDKFADADIERMRASLETQGLVAVRMPIPITRTNGQPEKAEVLVYLKKPLDLGRTEEIYVRSGLVIGEEQHLRGAPGRFYGLMLASDPLASEFLGFAEEASHMKWNARELEVTSRFGNVPATIAMVRHGLPKLAKLLLGQASGRHDDALIDFLSIPSPDNAGRKANSTRRRGKTNRDPDGGTDAPSKPRFSISQNGTAWRVVAGPGAADLDYPVHVRIDLAYATMPGEGNPFKAYHRFEFDLSDDKAHVVSLHNASVIARDLNRIELELTAGDFEISVDGFSEHALRSRISEVAV